MIQAVGLFSVASYLGINYFFSRLVTEVDGANGQKMRLLFSLAQDRPL